MVAIIRGGKALQMMLHADNSKIHDPNKDLKTPCSARSRVTTIHSRLFSNYRTVPWQPTFNHCMHTATDDNLLFISEIEPVM